MKRTLCIVLLLTLFTACSNPDNESDSPTKGVTISAATSLSGVLEEIIPLLEQVYPDTTITVNLGSSGKLAQQIEQGAPTDIFLSADQQYMDQLENKQLILPDSRTNFASNSLVLIGSSETSYALDDLNYLLSIDENQIAIGNPNSVPAGKYAKEALENKDLWRLDNLQSQLVFAKDVRQVLTYVSSGNAGLGFVYKSDLNRDESVKTILSIDESLHSPIIYPAAVVSTTSHPDIAKEMTKFLTSSEVQQILDKYGFES
ncbi:molybdate ABC transporter substrate-binding protein [Ornithinibacillus halophilus]|uniref:Molybdate transport system substrate-binding protein n=1 Tax=Ornithinibacillus halophilus TaxID=930117 RepID=A0A1M5G0V1_9BACI|nr:molybdate ABC transporter substrate-binding protein [Ornithinibacillus halophilus]SHF97062.1 molybdate transport system substrate-binding protein [Ornithinibacillus halophilus]